MVTSIALLLTFFQSLASDEIVQQLIRGSLIQSFYADLVGIRPDPTGIAFSKSIISPKLVPGVLWAKASSDSARGRISCCWRISGPRFHLDVTIPASTTSTIYVPTRAGRPIRIYYSGSKSVGFFASQDAHNDTVPIQVKGGHYVFDSLIQ
jgi:alpha-L-rhamnosidase